MKIIPILAITNALALAAALYLYVEIGDLRSQSGSHRSESGETSRLTARIDSLQRDLDRALAMRGLESTPVTDGEAAVRIPSSAPAAAIHGGGEGAAAAAGTGEEAPDAGAVGAGADDLPPHEMDVFRQRVKRAIELNTEEEQKNRVIERIDQLVDERKIAALNPRQKDGVAATVLNYRKKVPDVWRKLQESGAFENVSREERGRMVRAEYDSLRTEAQHALEEFMPAVDAKTYLDETMRDQMRGGFNTFGGPGGPPSPGIPGRAR